MSVVVIDGFEIIRALGARWMLPGWLRISRHGAVPVHGLLAPIVQRPGGNASLLGQFPDRQVRGFKHPAHHRLLTLQYVLRHGSNPSRPTRISRRGDILAAGEET